MTASANVPIPTEDLIFIDTDKARMLAVEALLISRARTKLSIYDAFFSLTSDYLSLWAESQGGDLDGNTAAFVLSWQRRTKGSQFYLHMPENDPKVVILNEVLPVGQMVHEIMKGRTKDQAMDIAIQTFTGSKEGKRFEEIMALPKAARQLSKKTLERRWQQFHDTLHYVGLYTFNHVRVVAGEPLIPLCQGKAFFEEMQKLLEKHATTKKIKLSEPTFLDFKRQAEFSDVFSEIPPLG